MEAHWIGLKKVKFMGKSMVSDELPYFMVTFHGNPLTFTRNLHISWENPWLIQLKIHDRLVYPMFEKGTTDRLRFPLQPIHLKQTLKRRLEEMMIFGDGAGFEYLLC